MAQHLVESGHKVVWLAVGPETNGDEIACRKRRDGVIEWEISPAFSSSYPVCWKQDEDLQVRKISNCLDVYSRKQSFDVIHLFHFARIGLRFINLPALELARKIATLTDYTAICADFQLFKRSEKRICDGKVPAAECLNCIGIVDRNPALGLELDDWRNRNIEVLNREFDCFFVQTPFQRSLLNDHGIDARSCVSDRAAYRIPPAWFNQNRLQNALFRFGFIGRASVEKGIEVAVNAFQEFHKKSHNCELHLYTDAEANEQIDSSLLQLVDSRSDVMLFPTVEHEALGSILNNFDCLLIPSLWLENHPTVLSYALDLGVPVICSDVASLRHISDSSLLHYAETGSVHSWSDKMEEVVKIAKRKIHMKDSPGNPEKFANLMSKLQKCYLGEQI